MSNVFALAIDDLFADANLAVAAVYTPAAGPAASVRAMTHRAEETGARLHGTMVRLSAAAQETALRVQIRKAEVAAPARGDSVTIDGITHPVLRVELDDAGLVWHLGLGQPA